MDIRLNGTETECAEAVEILRTALHLRAVSRFYTNRGDTILGRVYVDAEPLPTGPVQTTAQRADRTPRAALDRGR